MKLRPQIALHQDPPIPRSWGFSSNSGCCRHLRGIELYGSLNVCQRLLSTNIIGTLIVGQGLLPTKTIRTNGPMMALHGFCRTSLLGTEGGKGFGLPLTFNGDAYASPYASS